MQHLISVNTACHQAVFGNGLGHTFFVNYLSFALIVLCFLFFIIELSFSNFGQIW